MSTQNVLFDAPGPKARARHLVLTVVGGLIVAGIAAAVLWKFNEQGQLEGPMWRSLFTADVWTQYLLPGLWATIKAAAISIVGAMIFGIIFGTGRLSHVAPIRWFCGVVVEFFRAVPVLLMMYFLFSWFAVQAFFDAQYYPIAATVIALTLYNGSVIAELVRSGVFGLPKGQREAGLSVGLTRSQSLRSIELPQALTAMLPALVSQLVVVLKDSALGSALPYIELLSQVKNVGTAYGNVIPAYILGAALFILLNYALTFIAGRIERRINKRGKTAGGTVAAPLPGTTAEDPTT
ncbi:amino acid ABC transporter permease [Knoellia subterranea]|uniref:Glutamate ABC transporter permease n=1 Tax=Knoellia subterranea KCTC 19937 TaxID=1385521 RepID=A0A0A0JNR5_9MICO|nr:amino acid ABC transporter permease [Knoellia subterranea]KGN39025.1 glutamate ABC transporter permease [Knoellia subterranea KCTC 19937]